MSSRLVRVAAPIVAGVLLLSCASDDSSPDRESADATDPATVATSAPGDAVPAGTELPDTESANTEPGPSEPTDTEPAATEPPDTGPPDAEPEDSAHSSSPVSSAPEDRWADVQWVAHRGDPNDPSCQCADGSEHMFHSLDRDPDKVLLYYQGGGACFSAETCDFVSGTYKVTTDEDDHPGEDATGIFDWDDPDNPFADWSVVFVPYCSGDVFQGNAETEYAPGFVVQHRGGLHAQKGLDYVVDTYPDAAQLFVAGSSAGGVPTPKIGGLAADALPDTEITVLADASGGYASRQPLNAAIGGLWGTAESLPDWPELADVDPTEIGIPNLFTIAGQHAPRVEFARFDNAFDQVQQSFSSLAGGDTTVLDVLDENEAATEAGGVDLDVYVAPGTDHTILGRPELYTLEVEGVTFLEWLTTLVETGAAPGDVRCADCGQPAS
jgi:hypothetical protein